MADYDAYVRVCDALGVSPRPDGGYVDAPCPKCGHYRKGTTHFHISAELGRCFACGYKGGTGWVAYDLGLSLGETIDLPKPEPKAPKPPAVWQQNPEAWVAEFCRHPDRVTLWRRYKPVTVDQVHRYQLGVGVLPAGTSRCRHERLILPVRYGGVITGFRARRIDGACTIDNCSPDPAVRVANWVAAAGSTAALFNADRIAERARALIARQRGLRPLFVSLSENPIDALLIEQHLLDSFPRGAVDAVGTAILSVSNYKDEWADLIAAADPRVIVVWLDNDPQGQAIGATRTRLLASYRQSHGGQEPPVVGMGMRWVNELRARRVNAHLLRWPDIPEVPAKADPGWALAQFGIAPVPAPRDLRVGA